MYNQLGQRGVEAPVSKREPLGNSAHDTDLREAVADRRDERGGRIDRSNSSATEPLHEPCR
jgi:hypothetical protein